MPVLQQRRAVAELAGDLEVLRGRVEVALLAEDVREPDVQVPGRRKHCVFDRAESASPRPRARPRVHDVAVRLEAVTFDVADAPAVAAFWAGLLGREVRHGARRRVGAG